MTPATSKDWNVIVKIRFAVVTLLCLTPVQGSARDAPAGPLLSVTPSAATLDAPFNVMLKGVTPGARVQIRATRRAGTSAPWTASAVYIADPKGAVDASHAQSVAGTYVGVSAHGLICSALPVEPDQVDDYLANISRDPRLRLPPSDANGRMIEVTATIDGKVVASASAWRGYAEGSSGDEVDAANNDGWKGVYFSPTASVRRGAPVLLLPGSGGGILRSQAAMLAGHGHPVLALAMFRYPGLPDSLINYPIERVRSAADWLATRAGGQRPVVTGDSRGSEAAALAAVNFPDTFSGVILVVPSHFADAGALGPAAKPGDSAWTVDGMPTLVTDLGFSPDDPRVAEQAKTLPGYNASAMVLDKWDSPQFEVKYGIPFERIKAPLLVLAAGDDAVWPSWISAQHIQRRLAAHGKARQAEVHIYPKAGHSMATVGLSSPLSTFTYHTLLQGFLALGGQPNDNCEASFDSFSAILAFLNRRKTH